MNIQDTISELGLDIDNLPRILKQRVATVEDLQTKIGLAEQEVADDPTEESEAKLKEVKDYTTEYFNDAKSQLESYKAKLEKKEEKKEVLDAKPTDGDDEKKSSGMGALLIGGVLLVATLGAVNIMRKK
tara:strand:+ start:2186 stop:2572 length:387 start_codon:yes stop_codon:yes gene_type:complete